MKYNSQEIVTAVTAQNKSLVFISREFMSKSLIGAFIKNEDGTLIKIHGKSANAARSVLTSIDGICRSYGKAKLNKNGKLKSVFMTELCHIDFIA